MHLQINACRHANKFCSVERLPFSPHSTSSPDGKMAASHLQIYFSKLCLAICVLPSPPHDSDEEICLGMIS